jgi:hypothetical protein
VMGDRSLFPLLSHEIRTLTPSGNGESGIDKTRRHAAP